MIKVLGIGSSFGDDQVGWCCIEALKSKSALQGHVSNQELILEICDRPGLHLINLLQGFNSVFLIDAIKTDAAIGTIHRFEEQQTEFSFNTLSSHGFGVAQALQLGSSLNMLPREIILYGIEIGKIDCFAPLTANVNHAVSLLVDRMTSELLSRLDR